MTPCYALDRMDRTMKDIVNNNLLFVGKIVILGADYLQLLPVLPRANRSELIDLSIRYILWNSFTKFELCRNMRIIDKDIAFSRFVLDIANGDLNYDDNNVNIPERCIIRYGLFCHN